MRKQPFIVNFGQLKTTMDGWRKGLPKPNVWQINHYVRWSLLLCVSMIAISVRDGQAQLCLRCNSFSIDELSASAPGYRTLVRCDTRDSDQSAGQNCDRPHRSSGRDDLDSQVPQPSANNKTMISPETLAKARANGSVRVIVELQLGPYKEESEESRENAIRVAQQALLGELTKVNHRVIRTYTAIPVIVLAASAEALGIIAASPHVTRVTEDELSVPFKQTQPKR